MASKITITDPKELEEFARTHLDHRLTALVAPILDEATAYRSGRGDISKAAQEGSYVMLRLFIEFLGVKGQEIKSGSMWGLEERSKLPKNNKKKPPGSDIQETDLVLSCFVDRGGVCLKNLGPTNFKGNEEFIGKIHRTLCKINAHFTYNAKEPKIYDRIASLTQPQWERAVEIVVNKLDEHFYQKLEQKIVIHRDLQAKFKKRFTDVKSVVTSNP